MSGKIEDRNLFKWILNNSNLTLQLVEEEINNIVFKFGKRIDKTSALLIACNMLGYNLDNTKYDTNSNISIMTIDEESSSINIIGRVVDFSSIKTYNRKDNISGFYGNLLLRDIGGTIKVILWDEQTKHLESNYLKSNALIKIENGYAKKNNITGQYEIHLNSKSSIVFNPVIIDETNYPLIDTKTKKKLISEITVNETQITIEGKIKYIGQKKEYESGKMSKSIMVTDSSGQAFVTFWNDKIEEIEKISVFDEILISDLRCKPNYKDPSKISLDSTKNTKIELYSDNLGLSNILELQKLTHLPKIQSFQGTVQDISEIRTVNTRNGENVVCSMLISDKTDFIKVSFWGPDIKYILNLRNGMHVMFSNILIKYSDYSERNEGTFMRKSSMEY